VLLTFVYGPLDTVARYTEYPLTPDDVLNDHCSATAWLVVDTPVPLTGTLIFGAFVASLLIAIEPAALPAVVGAKLAVRVVLCPGARVVLPLIPVAPKPTPLTASPEIVRFEFPLFVSVNGCAAVEFTVTLPNATLVGDTPSTRVTDVPVPLTAIDNELSEAVDAIVTAPLTLPALLGKKLIVS
jgi:hypothetical protein